MEMSLFSYLQLYNTDKQQGKHFLQAIHGLTSVYPRMRALPSVGDPQ